MIRRILAALAAVSLGSVAAGSVQAQSVLDPSFEITAFGDFPIEGDSSEDSFFNARLDAYLAVRDIWEGGSLSFHLEYLDGDDFEGLGGAGVVWPTNVYAAVPKATSSNNATLSFTLTQKITPATSVTFGKFNVVALAKNTPLLGGNGKGGFQYTGIAASPTFVFPPYVFGGSLAVTTERWNYSLMIYDPNNAQGGDFWDHLFEDGVVFNGTATYKAQIGGLPGFYAINLIHSTAEGTNYDSLASNSAIDTFSQTTKGITVASLKFQQYLSHNPAGTNEGWGVFGQLTFGDGNPNQLDNIFVLGVGGTSPIEGRSDDRWGLAWARFNWSDKMVAALEAGGGAGLRDEWAVEAYYEAALVNGMRVGANVMHIHPGTPGYDDYTQFGVRFRATF
ncbi:carbohydrate porin [Maritimibacter alkaliphilus]|uniref:carbohydrate porin n=1 Tax=Maritimibacter alkaliphilus TaxID=404236 RepID=UPI001C96AE4F|nr:carbohydrate porin [Maritimibacter alkaliphilus]MBY6091090.1 carbohydrate porin [Maritimibacter alkaliphilus]